MNKRFSLVFPTRKRVDLLENLFRSLDNNTFDKESIEILPVFDDDDEVTGVGSLLLPKIFPNLDIKFVKQPRTRYLNRDYINFAAEQSTGKYIFILNDDTEFQTINWDEVAWDLLETYLSSRPDGIVYGCIDDSMNALRVNMQDDMKYCGFPIISRSSLNTLGYAMHPAFSSWGADVHLYKVYHAVDRVLPLHEVKILHICRYNNLRAEDETNRNVAALSDTGGDAWANFLADTNKLRIAMGIAPIQPPIIVHSEPEEFPIGQSQLQSMAPVKVPRPKKPNAVATPQDLALQSFKRRMASLNSKRSGIRYN